MFDFHLGSGLKSGEKKFEARKPLAPVNELGEGV